MRGLIIEQMMDIGVRSLPLVIFVGVFAGAVASIQTAYQLKGYISFNYLGAATSVAVFIELGPVLTALVAAGRIGASIAAELGTMRVTEQIDAMEALAIDPVRYLAPPNAQGGAEGVGQATIRAFVISAALILLNDYLLSLILF